MIKFSTPSKKDFLNFLNKFNTVLSDKLALLTKKNFKQILVDLIYDRRFVITIFIALLTIFAHLSTPAFYQDKWVLSKIKKQLQNEFDIELILPEEVSYSMFPIPSFHIKNIEIANGDRKFGKIENMKVNLSYKKFLNKEKINLQNIHISNCQFNIQYKDINDFLDFFQKKINSKKMFIEKSSIFLEDTKDETYLILQIKNGISFFDEIVQLNKLNLNGEIYNTPFKLVLENNYNSRISNLKMKFPDLNILIENKLNYSDKINNGNLIFTNALKDYEIVYNFNKNYLNFLSKKEDDKNFFYEGNLKFKPFTANLRFEYNSIDLIDLLNNDSILYELVRSNVFFNENLNYKINLTSKKIKNYKKLNSLDLKVNFNQGILNFNDTYLFFDETLKFKVVEGTYVNNINEENFYGEILIEILDNKKMYSFLQTNKKYRNNIKNISVEFKFDYKNNELFFEKILIQGKSSNEVSNLIKQFNSEQKGFTNIVQIKKFSNEILQSFKMD